MYEKLIRNILSKLQILRNQDISGLSSYHMGKKIIDTCFVLVFFLILKSELMSFSDDLLLLFIYVLFGSCFCILHKYIFYTSVVIVLVDRSLIAIYTQNNYRYSTFASNLVSLSSCISDNLLRIMSRFK